MCFEGLEGTLFGQPRAMLHSAASKNGLRRSSPPPRSAASPSLSHKPDVIHHSRRDADARSRHHLPSLHHSAASSRDQLVQVSVVIIRLLQMMNLFAVITLSSKLSWVPVTAVLFSDIYCSLSTILFNRSGHTILARPARSPLDVHCKPGKKHGSTFYAHVKNMSTSPK